MIECHEEVTRRGELEPCDKAAVAMRLDVEGLAYPVCIYHTRAPMVPLSGLSDRFLAERDKEPHRGRRVNRDYNAGYRMAMEDAARIVRGMSTFDGMRDE
jgi:hypothetical protein